jgi:CRP-like cAMP-binding protein
MDKQQIRQYLHSITLFEGIENDQLEKIIADSRTVLFDADETLFYQEDPADVFYVLIEGRIKLSQLTLEGDQVTLHYLSPGEAFGIIAVLREIQFPVTAQAIEASQCIVWSEEVTLQVHPEFSGPHPRTLYRTGGEADRQVAAASGRAEREANGERRIARV